MEKEDIIVTLALQHMGCKFIISPEEQTLMYKKIYIAQTLGLNLGYSFYWYLKGPYSKALSNTIFNIISQDSNEWQSYELTAKTLLILHKVNSFEKNKPDDLSITQWYILLASMLFIRDEYGINGLKEEILVKDTIKECQPWYNTQQINKAWDIVKTI